MRAIEYASPGATKQAVGLLSADVGPAEVLAGGTDLLALMKDDVDHAEAAGQHQGDRGTRRRPTREASGLRIGALTALVEARRRTPTSGRQYPAARRSVRRSRQPADPQHGDARRQSLPAPALLVFPQRLRPACQGRSGKVDGRRRRQPLSRDPRQRGPAKFVSPSTIVPVLIAYNAKVRLVGPSGKREVAREVLTSCQRRKKTASTI